MSGRCLRSSSAEKSTGCNDNIPVQQFKLGDIIWCRINGRTWWPVQVVDANCVAFKPKKKKKDQICVRLYGTFEHMYVEQVNCISKNDKIFGQKNSSSKKIFENALNEDLFCMKSGGHSETRIFESHENSKVNDEAPGRNEERKRKLKRTLIDANSSTVDSFEIPKAAKQVKIIIRGQGRRKKSETLKATNEGKSGMESAIQTQNLNDGAYTISSSGKRYFRLSRHNSGKKLNASLYSKASESDCEWNSDACKNAQVENADDKYIRKLVAKIVKEVAAEEARVEEMESYPENTEYVETSWRKSYETENMKQHIPRGVENQDMDLLITGVIDDNQDKILNDIQDDITGSNPVGNRYGGDRVKNLSMPNFDSDDNEMKKDTGIDAFGSMEINEDQGVNGVHSCQSIRSDNYLRVIEAVKCSVTLEAVNGDQRCEVVKDVSREHMVRSGSTKCSVIEESEELSPRRTRIMQNLGLVAPSGSPFRRNGLIESS